MMREAVLAALQRRLPAPTMSVSDGLPIVIDALKEVHAAFPDEIIVAGIAGGSGSGKTSQVAAGIQRAFPDGQVNVLTTDNFYHGARFLQSLSVALGRVVSWDEPEAVD